MDALLTYEKILTPSNIFWFLVVSLIGCGIGGLLLDTTYLVLLPFALLVGLFGVLDVRNLYYLLVLVIPITIEFYLPNGLGIDIPGEPLLIILTAISPFVFFTNIQKKDLPYYIHPITVALLFHVGWILIAALLGANIIVGIKFFLAKIWYVIPFFGFTIFVFRNKLSYRTFFWCLMIPLILSVLFVLGKHAMDGFTFTGINSAVSPIYRNHVNYGLLMVGFLPYVWAFYTSYRGRQFSLERLILLIIGAILLIAIYFTYTRAAQLSVFIGIACYFIIRWRLIVPVLLAGMIGVVFLAYFFVNESKYLDFAPQFEKTITHENYDNLIEATVKLEDISTMERVNRWVAGGHMVKERPLTGFGPGNFYFNYKDYMVSSFVTYVSDNPDKSGIHNYFLMILVEQGLIGLLVFVILIVIALVYGGDLYHKITDPFYKNIVMAALISLILIIVTILINDLLEALKIGALFFIALAILVKEGVRVRHLS